MKIERIDDNTIKCYISLEEMEYYQVEYNDFITRTEKAQKLMHVIIKQAESEVGYQPPRFAFEMQIMMVPDQGMVLTFSEKEPFDVNDKGKVDSFLEHLKEFASKLAEYREQSSAGKSSTSAQAKGKANHPMDVKSGKGTKRAEVNEAVFVFESLSRVMDFVDELPSNIRIATELYKLNEEYYLHISRGGASYDRYSKVCVVALEFGRLFLADVGCDDFIKEHGECLIEEKAHKKLRK